MLTLHGVGTTFGVGDGALHLYISPRETPKSRTISDAQAECTRLDEAISVVLAQLAAESQALRDAGQSDTGEALALLSERSDMLQDNDFLSAVRTVITENHFCADYAVYSTGKAYATRLCALDDAYLRRQADSVAETAQRVVGVLVTRAHNHLLDNVTGRVVLAANTLLPGEAVQLDRSKIAAFLMRDGAPNSTAAILARSLGIPTVTGLGDDFDKLEVGVRTMVDGESGLVAQNPDTPTMSQLAQRMLVYVREERQQQMLRGVPAQTADGVTIALTANISLPEDAQKAQNYDAEGIGLFRSEILYLKDGAFPDEDTLYKAYREVLLMMGGKRVVVRLLDFGSDKTAFCPGRVDEKNEALGIRPVPYCLANPALITPQLRALLRASAYGNLAILLPMVVEASEVRAMKERIDILRKELRTEHKQVSEHIAVGALIETPAAAATADLIAAEADFLSVGTNDLTQYVLVTDRTSMLDNSTLNSYHPAVLRTVAQVVRMAHAAGVPVSICGECAANPALAGFFAGLRVTELSMAATCIPRVKKAIRALTDEACRNALKERLQVTHAPRVRTAAAPETEISED